MADSEVRRGSLALGAIGIVFGTLFSILMLVSILFGMYDLAVVLAVICAVLTTLGVRNILVLITQDETNEGVEPIEEYTH